MCGATDCRSCGPAQGYRLINDDEGDAVIDALESVRTWLSDAEDAHKKGQKSLLTQCLREARATLDELAA